MDSSRGKPRGFSAAATALYAALWALLVLDNSLPLLVSDPVERLQHPVPTAQRMIERDLETATAAEASVPSQRRLWELLLGTRADALDYAVLIQEDLLRFLESSSATESHELDLVRAQLALLLAEQGATENALLRAEEVVGIQGFSQGMHFLYGEAHPPAPGLDAFLSSGAAAWLGPTRLERRT